MTIFRGVVTRIMGHQFVAEIEDVTEPANPREEITLALGFTPKIGAMFDWKIDGADSVIDWDSREPLTDEQIASAFAEADRVTAILEAA